LRGIYFRYSLPQMPKRKKQTPIRDSINWVETSEWFTTPKQSRSRASMQRVYDSALRLFAEKGFDSTTPADIAKAAGVTTGSIYNRFLDKEAILYTIIDTFSKSRVPEVTRLCDPQVWRNRPADEILSMYIEMMFSAYQHDANVIRIIERRRLVDPAIARKISDLNEHVVSSFSTLLSHQSEQSISSVKKKFRVLHTLIRGFLVHRILADPGVPEHDLPISHPDFKAMAMTLALNTLKKSV